MRDRCKLLFLSQQSLNKLTRARKIREVFSIPFFFTLCLEFRKYFKKVSTFSSLLTQTLLFRGFFKSHRSKQPCICGGDNRTRIAVFRPYRFSTIKIKLLKRGSTKVLGEYYTKYFNFFWRPFRCFLVVPPAAPFIKYIIYIKGRLNENYYRRMNFAISNQSGSNIK